MAVPAAGGGGAVTFRALREFLAHVAEDGLAIVWPAATAPAAIRRRAADAASRTRPPEIRLQPFPHPIEAVA